MEKIGAVVIDFKLQFLLHAPEIYEKRDVFLVDCLEKFILEACKSLPQRPYLCEIQLLIEVLLHFLL